ncbi:cytochrome b-c1 complex subunit 9 [Bombus huntii]|uniref:cytochrome b-c1 complex subunit 9 n=1 Tax=Bombus huntii TaxID=85661 RepID=UPI0021A9B796|nr:cytochrome b-c1 complex subunit 9 [Bombus huntii]
MAFIYNLFKRSSTFTLSILAATFFFERGFDMIGDTIFDRLNEGKLWKHIKRQYEEQ